MKGLSEKRLSDYMAEQIADEILAGRIEGGSQLKQEELAEVFGASRIPIREAFQVLESQGLIVRLATKRKMLRSVISGLPQNVKRRMEKKRQKRQSAKR